MTQGPLCTLLTYILSAAQPYSYHFISSIIKFMSMKFHSSSLDLFITYFTLTCIIHFVLSYYFFGLRSQLFGKKSNRRYGHVTTVSPAFCAFSWVLISFIVIAFFLKQFLLILVKNKKPCPIFTQFWKVFNFFLNVCLI